MMQGSKLLAVMMIWRFMSFYLGLILGAAGNLIHRKKEKTDSKSEGTRP